LPDESTFKTLRQHGNIFKSYWAENILVNFKSRQFYVLMWCSWWWILLKYV
jgi:hypothetical protein